MAIVEMEKLKLFVHKSVSTNVFRAIQKLGILEFTDIKNKESLEQVEKKVFEFNYVSSRLDFAINFLSRWENQGNKSNRIRRAIEGNKVFTTDTEVEETANTFYFNGIIDSAQDIEESMNDTDTKLKKLQAEKIILEEWKHSDIPLSIPLETKTTKTVFLTGTTEELSALSKDIQQENILNSVKMLDQEHFTISLFKKDFDIFLKKIDNYNITIEEPPKRRGTPAEEIERIDRAINKNKKTTILLEKKACELAENLPKLKIVGDRIFWKKEKYDLLSHSYKKNDILVFEGWCPKANVIDLEKTISEETKLFVLEKTTPEKDERPPVEIKNNAIIKPFETVTRLYGLPGNKDLDPTPFLAGFFFIFFGLSLTDVGYGLFLFITTASLLTFFKVPKNIKPMLSLIMLGGISSFIVGLLFGGYLGIDMKYLPEWAQKIQMFDPIANPLPVFYMALTFGVIQIIFGLVLKIIQKIKENEAREGFLDKGPWLALFVSLIFWGAVKIGFIGDSFGIAVLAIYGALLSLVLTQGRKEKTIIKKLFKGVFSLYDSINYFSDILSYSRLLALGLATSALAFAVNLIATMVGDMIPYVGTFLMVIILIVGHLFNLAVNTLGAFIHSARLQFVEFFGKFITDSGKIFTPFKREERYIVVVK